jgi:hypothetical protein
LLARKLLTMQFPFFSNTYDAICYICVGYKWFLQDLADFKESISKYLWRLPFNFQSFFSYQSFFILLLLTSPFYQILNIFLSTQCCKFPATIATKSHSLIHERKNCGMLNYSRYYVARGDTEMKNDFLTQRILNSY